MVTPLWGQMQGAWEQEGNRQSSRLCRKWGYCQEVEHRCLDQLAPSPSRDFQTLRLFR